jgi:hypothetical protein
VLLLSTLKTFAIGCLPNVTYAYNKNDTQKIRSLMRERIFQLKLF